MHLITRFLQRIYFKGPGTCEERHISETDRSAKINHTYSNGTKEISYGL